MLAFNGPDPGLSRSALYVAVTGHGFGHAARAAAVAAAVRQRRPQTTLIFVTTAPRWLLEVYCPDGFVYRRRTLDVGVVQSDSLKMDKIATLHALRRLREQEPSIVAEESAFIRENNVGLVLADIPPLAGAIAKAAGVPCWMMGNFGWDFIYRDWGGEFHDIADWSGELYRTCERLFRLPMHEPMRGFPAISDVGLTGGVPRCSPDELHTRFGLSAIREQNVLLTFGGLGLDAVPYANLHRFPDWRFITFDTHAPALPNLIRVTDRSLRPVDFMPACGLVLCKPGYSTVSEALMSGTPIVSLTREDFAESPFIIAGIRDHARHRFVTADEFFRGDWEFLRRSLQSPVRSDPPTADGNDAVARAVAEF